MSEERNDKAAPTPSGGPEPESHRAEGMEAAGQEAEEPTDIQEQAEEHEARQARKFGAFAGVFTPTLLTILGVIMFLREGWIVGNAGLGGANLPGGHGRRADVQLYHHDRPRLLGAGGMRIRFVC